MMVETSPVLPKTSQICFNIGLDYDDLRTILQLPASRVNIRPNWHEFNLVLRHIKSIHELARTPVGRQRSTWQRAAFVSAKSENKNSLAMQLKVSSDTLTAISSLPNAPALVIGFLV
jgi:hypothetical protein